MYKSVLFRPAQPFDVPNLVCLIDSAGRGLPVWLWSTLRQPGQSAIEVGRQRILTKTDHPFYYKNWTVAEVDGAVVGALMGCVTSESYRRDDANELPQVFVPLLELEALAGGSWYLNVLAVYPEFRGQGIGTALLSEAEAIARATGASRISIIVEDANAGAFKLYLRFGFIEQARRPYIPFPGSMDEGDWILLIKDT
jgi:ribosomal protein S18 acetylase RimI-like enzyme